MFDFFSGGKNYYEIIAPDFQGAEMKIGDSIDRPYGQIDEDSEKISSLNCARDNKEDREKKTNSCILKQAKFIDDLEAWKKTINQEFSFRFDPIPQVTTIREN